MRSALKTALVAFLISACLVGLLFVANYWSLGRGGQETVSRAFASGQLGDEDFRRGDALLGYQQYNDCLILGMALDQRYSKEELTVSPSVPFGANDTEICKALRRGTPATDRFFYHNYLHGQVTLVRYLLPVLSVDQIRALYRLLITFTLASGIAICLLRRNLVFLIVLLGFSRCFGLETFGQSLGHAPADLVLVGFVTFLAVARLTPRAAVIASVVFGGLTMIFEMMTGGLPLGLAVVIGLTWFSLTEKSVRNVTLAALSCLTAAGSALAIKYAAAFAVFGSLDSVFAALRIRTLGHAPAFMDGRTWPEAVFGNMEAMIPGMGPLAGLLLLLAIGFGVMGIIRYPTTENKLLAASNVPVFLWLIVFHQHTIVHAWFMDRMLVWPMVTGFAIYGLATQDLAAPRPSTSASRHQAKGRRSRHLINSERIP